jgi:N utilization substance protein A
MEVIVADDQLSLAIGRRGQNVKLATKLTGWKIDVRSISVAEEESKRARLSLEGIVGIDFTEVEMLFQHGYRNPRQVALASLEELLEVKGLSAEAASRILNLAKDFVAALPVHDDDDDNNDEDDDDSVSELHRLGLTTALKECLETAGYRSIQSLAALSFDDLLAVPGMTEADADTVKQALDSFLKGGGIRVM